MLHDSINAFDVFGHLDWRGAARSAVRIEVELLIFAGQKAGGMPMPPAFSIAAKSSGLERRIRDALLTPEGGGESLTATLIVGSIKSSNPQSPQQHVSH